MKNKVFYIWTHDSIGVGEDGATHQPIEQLSHFRAMPNLNVFRPSDANENVACWQTAFEIEGPCAFVLSRQNLPVLSPIAKEQVKKGAYIKKPSKKEVQVTLLATGSEVALALKSAEKLEENGIDVQVVSVPCYDLFIQQDRNYKDSLLQGLVVAIEASRGLEWYALADIVVGMQNFGASGKGEMLFEHFGFNVANIVKIVEENL